MSQPTTNASQVPTTNTNNLPARRNPKTRPREHSASPNSRETSAHVLSAVGGDSLDESNPPLPTAIVIVRSDTGRKLPARALMDSASQRSFIRRDLAEELGLERKKTVHLTIEAFQHEGRGSGYDVVEPTISFGGRCVKVALTTTDYMPERVISPGLHDAATALRKSGHRLADHGIVSDVVTNIQILIGNDFLGRFLAGSLMTTVNNIDVIESPGGYLIYGYAPDNLNPAINPTTAIDPLTINVLSIAATPHFPEPRTIPCSVTNDVTQMHKLWDLDVVGINPLQEAPNDERSLSHYENTVQYADGRYWVELPFKVDRM